MRHAKKFFGLGAPYHGLVLNSELELPNAQTITLQDWVASPHTDILENPAGVLQHTPYTTAEQAAHAAAGHQYLAYGVRNGNTFEGIDMPSYRWALYSDSAGNAWLIEVRVTWTSGLPPAVVSVRLRGLFGRVRINGDPIGSTYSADRELTSSSITPGNYPSGWEAGSDPFDYTAIIRQNKTGSKILLQFGRYWANDITKAKKYLWGESNEAWLLTDVYEISLTGAGAITGQTLGDGITASVSLVAGFSTLFSRTVDAFSDADYSWPTYLQLYCYGDIGWRIAYKTPPDRNKPDLYGTMSLDEQIQAKLFAYYDAAENIAYIEKTSLNADNGVTDVGVTCIKTLVDENTGEWEVARTATGSTNQTRGGETTLTIAGLTYTGAYSETETDTWNYADTITVFSDGSPGFVPDCCSPPNNSLGVGDPTNSTTPSGDRYSEEIHVKIAAPNGLSIVAQAYDNAGVKTYRRYVVAPNGTTEQLTDVTVLNSSAMSANGIAYDPASGVLYVESVPCGVI